MKQAILKASVRPEEKSKKEVKILRKQGKIPAVIYGGGGKAIHISILEKDYISLMSSHTDSKILELDLGGKSTRAFVKTHQRDCISNKVIHVDFLEVIKGRSIHAKIPIKLIGIPIGVREGGILENPAHEVDIECDPDNLPEHIDLDISSLQANHSIHIRNLPILNGVRILNSPELVVATVKFARAEAAPVAPTTTASTVSKEASPSPSNPDKKEEKKEDKK